MSSSHYERLERAISKYKEWVERVTRALRRNLMGDIVFIVVIPVALSIVALVWAGVIGFLTTLGLGGINAGERLTRGQTMLKNYWGESSKLWRTVATLETVLPLCDPSDEGCLQKVEEKLKGYLDALP